MTTRYLIDANIFIDAHNLLYHPDFCNLFWSWIKAGFDAEIFFSLDKVKDEIAHTKLKNELANLIRSGMFPNEFFLTSLSNGDLINSYMEVINWANDHPHYLKSAKEEFVDSEKADAFLIAVAKLHGYVIVSNEVSQPEEKKRIRIPDAAKHFGIRVIRLDKILKLYAYDNFTFQTAS
ncbi:DUF4411 family protein [Acinetobacter terrestris]|uniref:DUF4411 family protein n=1 Tax=Acinetobacter terrestris TaxID=2529843 RepID=UPI003525AF7C